MTFPTPWAWYRGDDLAGSHSELDRVDEWSDRAGGLGTSVRQTEAFPDRQARFTSDAINGQPGVIGPVGTGMVRYNATVPIANMPSDGMTVAMIVGDMDGTTSQNSMVGIDSVSSIATFGTGYQNAEGGFEVVEPGLTLSGGAHLLITTISDTHLRLWIDGSQVGEVSASYDPDPWSMGEGLSQFGVGESEVVGTDFIYWNWVLSEEELCGVHQYSYERYGTDTECGPPPSATGIPLRLITRTSQQLPNAPRVPGPNTYW